MNYDNFNFVLIQGNLRSTVWVDRDNDAAAFCAPGVAPGEPGASIQKGVLARHLLFKTLGVCPVCDKNYATTCVTMGWDSKTNAPATTFHCAYCAIEDGWYDDKTHTPEEAREIAHRLERENTAAWYAQRNTTTEGE